MKKKKDRRLSSINLWSALQVQSGPMDFHYIYCLVLSRNNSNSVNSFKFIK